MKRRLIIIGGIILGMLALFVPAVLIHRNYAITLDNGTSIHVSPASFWDSWFSEAHCDIFYRPKNGIAGMISLLQDSDSSLAMVMPAEDGKCLLGLYYADVHYRLIRIDPTAQSRQFPKDSYLNYIILSTPWNIQEGTSNDWEEVQRYLKTVPQHILKKEVLHTDELGALSPSFDKKSLLSEVNREIYYSQHGLIY